MRSFIHNTKGSAGVLLCLMLLSFVLVAGVLAGVLCLHGAKASLGRAAYLGGQSLLAEYDKHLLADYGLFAVRTDEQTGAETIRHYIEAAVMMKTERNKLDLFGIHDVNVSLDLKSASLMKLEQFEKQIKADMKYKTILDALGLSQESRNVQKQLTDSQDKRSGGKSTLLLAENEAKAAERAGAAQEESAGQTPGEQEEEQTEEMWKARQTIEGIKTLAGDHVKRTVNTGQGTEDHVLRNKAVIERLPTRVAGIKDGWFSKLLAGGDMLKNVFSGENSDFYRFENLTGDLVTGAYTNEYILKYCRNKQSGEWEKETFFKHEAEYVLYGKLQDGENAKAFKEEFITLRTGLNLIHILSDSEKNQAVTTLATTAFPGPWTPAVRLVVATAWAAAEATEDLKTLEEGGKVPLIKTRETWILSWDHLLSGGQANRSGKDTKTGLDYKEYLRLFLLGVSRETKLLRMMDIIQINMKGRYYKDFTIISCYTGFQVTAEAKTRALGPIFKQGGLPWISVESEHVY